MLQDLEGLASLDEAVSGWVEQVDLLRACSGEGGVLIRPDGYVALAGGATVNDAPPTRASDTRVHQPSHSCPHPQDHDHFLSKRHWSPR
ncbi:hypothetical protein [Nonomuraea sp. JJY05]|uniref:aromatic-ring hydroxylase C-terminal domain-containing protein n=1 Tax=Nonomuraea sp. JJY05 TaxID=3350255 RepID=UPI00373E5581